MSGIPSTIKPIETQYKNYRFRSRLEARYAVFFDKMGIEFEYEKEGFDLGELGYYLPDFWLPYPEDKTYGYHLRGSGHWLEVKALKPTDEEILKLLELSKLTNHSGILVFGPPGKNSHYVTHRNGGHQFVDVNFVCPEEKRGEFALSMICCRFTNNTDVHTGINAALSARFEHGEKP
jgi:hypothetical protein